MLRRRVRDGLVNASHQLKQIRTRCAHRILLVCEYVEGERQLDAISSRSIQF